MAYLMLGVTLGVIIGWLFGSRRSVAPADRRLEDELRHQLTQREAELSATREQLGHARTAVASAQANEAGAEKLLVEQRTVHERALIEAKVTQDKALADLRDAFKALSVDALKQTAPDFLRLAEQGFAKFQETATGDLATRQEAIKGLVEPLRQQLESYQTRLQQSDTSQSLALGEVKHQLEALSMQSASLANETQQFRMVLHSNQARGRWGEETLRRVIESSGMSAHCDFDVQVAEGDSRPDLVVNLPGDRFIIVDSKVPDLDFLTVLEAADPKARAELLVAHARKLKATVQALADRDYPHLFPRALDFVVLFVPAESLFSVALEGDPELITWAAERRILLATPASLIALLRSVSVSWQQHAQTENAQKIAEAAQTLYARVVVFAEHFAKIHHGLERATGSFNDAVASFQSRVRPAGERLKELGAANLDKELADVQPLDVSLRLPA